MRLVYAVDIDRPDTIKNDHVSVNLADNGVDIKSFTHMSDLYETTLNEHLYTYDGRSTHSCIYMFKPTMEARSDTYRDQKYYLLDGTLVKRYLVFGKTDSISFLKEIELIHYSRVPKVNLSQKFTQPGETALRFDTSKFTEFFTDNSYASPERKYIDVEAAINRNLTRPISSSRADILGLNTYPMVDGFSLKSNGIFAGIINSQTAAVQVLSESEFEIIVGRKVTNINQGKGLPESLNEERQTTFTYHLINEKDPKKFH